jgi:hypothetical protein
MFYELALAILSSLLEKTWIDFNRNKTLTYLQSVVSSACDELHLKVVDVINNNYEKMFYLQFIEHAQNVIIEIGFDKQNQKPIIHINIKEDKDENNSY